LGLELQGLRILFLAARAFEIDDELPRNGSFADGLHNLEVQEAVVRAAAAGNQTAVGA